MTFPFPAFCPVFPPATISKTADPTGDTATTTYSFATTSIGTAAADRRLIIAVSGSHVVGDTRTIDSVTVDASAATVVVELEAANRSVGLYIIAWPTGTTATIAVTFSATVQQCGVGVWAAYGLLSSTPVDFDSVSGTAAAEVFPALSTQDGGVAVWYMEATNSVATFTWTGGPTERFDEATGTVGISATHSGADAVTTGASITATATASEGVAIKTGVCASFR